MLEKWGENFQRWFSKGFFGETSFGSFHPYCSKLSYILFFALNIFVKRTRNYGFSFKPREKKIKGKWQNSNSQLRKLQKKNFSDFFFKDFLVKLSNRWKKRFVEIFFSDSKKKICSFLFSFKMLWEIKRNAF